MSDYKVKYQGEILDGYTADKDGNFFGKSGKQLTVTNGRITVSIDSKRKNVNISDLSIVKPTAPKKTGTVTITLDNEPTKPIIVAPNVVKLERDILAEIDAVRDFAVNVGVPDMVILSGLTLNTALALGNGTATREEIDNLYRKNIYAFAIGEVNLNGAPFKFNELRFSVLYSVVNSISVLINRPRYTGYTTSMIVAAIHSILYNGKGNEFLLLGGSAEDNRLLMEKTASIIKSLNNIPHHEFTITEGFILHNPTGNKITTFLANISGVESAKSRANGLKQPVQFFDDYEFIENIDIIIDGGDNDTSNALYGARIGGSTINPNIKEDELIYLESLAEIDSIAQANDGDTIFQLTFTPDKITGYDAEAVAKSLNNDQNKINSEINMVRKFIYDLPHIMKNTKLKWYTEDADVENALKILDSSTISDVPEAILHDIVEDGIVPLGEIDDSIITLYSIRYVNSILKEGVHFAKGLKYDDPKQALFAAFGTDSEEFIDLLFHESNPLKTAYMEFFKISITLLVEKIGSVNIEPFIGAFGFTAKAYLELCKAIKEA